MANAGSSPPGEREPMKEKNFKIVSRDAARQGRTNWKRVRRMTDAKIDAAIAHDADWAEFKDFDWSRADLSIPPKKKAISIRLDEDILSFFKHSGDGYQRRINAVLRSFVRTKRTKKRA